MRWFYFFCSSTLFVFIFTQHVYSESNGVLPPAEEERLLAEGIENGSILDITPKRGYTNLNLPSLFDRSTKKAFPPISSQKGGSCTGWATSYYSATYQIATREKWDAKKGGNAYWCSPQWTYNLINNGKDGGGGMSNNNAAQIKHGLATWKDFAQGKPNRHTSWCTDPLIWRKAITYRMESQSAIRKINSAESLTKLKEEICKDLSGCTFSTNSPSSGKHWVFTDIKDDPETSGDDAYVGEKACYYVKANNGGRHALAVIGYNDDIWVDVNQNGKLDPGEKGALKISESHGTKKGNKGFYWLAYDALNPESKVTDGPNSDRSPAFLSTNAYISQCKKTYTPKMFAQFTLQTAARIDVLVTFHRCKEDAQPPFSKPSASWKGYVFGTMKNSANNRLGFDGNKYESNPSEAPKGEFVFDLTDIMPKDEEIVKTWKYVMEIKDRKQGIPVTASHFSVIIPTVKDSLHSAENLPISVDNETKYAWVNVPPLTTKNKNKFMENHLKDEFLKISSSNNSITFTIDPMHKSNFSIQLFSLSGQLLWNYKTIQGNKSKNESIRCNLSSVKKGKVVNGVYVVFIRHSKGSFGKKISILKY